MAIKNVEPFKISWRFQSGDFVWWYKAYEELLPDLGSDYWCQIGKDHEKETKN